MSLMSNFCFSASKSYPVLSSFFISASPAGIYLLNVNSRNSRTRCERCEHVSHLVLVFLLLTLNMQLPAGSLFLFNAMPFANTVKQFLSSFSVSLMLATNSSSNDLLTSKSSLRFKLTSSLLFSLLTSCLALAFSAAIRMSLYFEYAALHDIMSCRLISKLCGFTEW